MAQRGQNEIPGHEVGKIGQGREASKVYLKEHPEVLTEIDEKVRAKVAELEA